MFGLHEAHGNYQPAALIERLSSVHKDQVFELGHHGPPPQDAAASRSVAGAAPAAIRDDDSERSELPTRLLKWYFLTMALVLTVSSGFGIWMGLTQIRRGALACTLLAIGILVPVALLLL